MDISEGLVRRIHGEEVFKYGKRLKGFKITPENIKTIEAYNQFLIGEDKKVSTRSTYVYSIALLADRLKKPFKSMTTEDILAFSSWLNDNKDIQRGTKNLYLMKVKAFFKWYMGSNQRLPDNVVGLKTTVKARPKTRSDMLTAEEVQKMIDCCLTDRDKALIASMYESGFRRSEIISCRIRDLVFAPEGYAILTVPEKSVAKSGIAKTGSYSAFLEQSIPYLRQYLNNHPDKANPDAPLWISLKNNNYGQPLENCGVYFAIRFAARRAGIKRKVTPHILRHSISTEWAKQGFSSQEINLRSGRKQNSTVADTYIHMVGSDVMDKILARRGFKPDAPQSNGKLLAQSKNCWKCSTPNPENNLSCFKCSAPLKGSERFEEMETALQFYQLLKKAKEDPEFIALLQKKAAKTA